MLDAYEVIGCIVIPGLVVWGFCFAVRRFEFSRWAPLAMGLGFALALVYLRWLGEYRSLGPTAEAGDSIARTWKRVISPNEARDWLIPFLAGAGLIGTLERICCRHRLTAIVWGALTSLALWRMLIGSVYLESKWSLLESCCWVGGVGVCAAAAYSLGGRKVEAIDYAWLTRWLLVAIGVASFVVQMMSGSQALGMIVFAWTSSVGHWALTGSFRKADRCAEDSGGFLAFAFFLVWLPGLFFAELTILNGVLLGSAILVSGLCKGKRSRWGVVLVVLIGLAFAGAAAGLAAQAFSKQMQEDAANPYTSIYGN
ncbi:MAG: hypothetical protein R3C03_20145 [Pirellulaceae bacterium]